MACLVWRIWKTKKNSKWEGVTSSVSVIKVQSINFCQFAIFNFTHLKLYYEFHSVIYDKYLSFFTTTTDHPEFVIKCCRTRSINFSVSIQSEYCVIIDVSYRVNFNSHDTVSVSTTRELKLRFILKLPQGLPLKFDSASFGGISRNRK